MTDLENVIQSLRENPSDDTTRHVLADIFDDLPASLVTRGMPKWLRLCWVRSIPPTGRRHGYSLWVVAMEMQKHIRDGWDHAGKTTIAGLECFVSEPYAHINDAPQILRPLRSILPCCAFGYARHGAHHRGVVRAIIFPPLKMPPAGTWKWHAHTDTWSFHRRQSMSDMTPTTESTRVALAPQGVFRTIQGEGMLLGVPRATGDEKEDLK